MNDEISVKDAIKEAVKEVLEERDAERREREKINEDIAKRKAILSIKNRQERQREIANNLHLFNGKG